MQAMALNIAERNFLSMFENAVRRSEATEINSNYGSAVLVDKNTWESMNETLLLLNDKTALKALLQGHEQRDNSIKTGKTIDEIFTDV